MTKPASQNSVRGSIGMLFIVLGVIGGLLVVGWTVTVMGRKIDKAPVILTVTGLITKPNRGTFDPDQDGIFKHHSIAFESAHGFSRRDLLAMPRHKLTAILPDSKTVRKFEGVKLIDVLKAAGASDGIVRLTALDGYTAELTPAELVGKDWTLALFVNGKPLALGGRGPIWLVHTPASKDLKVSEDESQKFVWSLFSINVRPVTNQAASTH